MRPQPNSRAYPLPPRGGGGRGRLEGGVLINQKPRKKSSEIKSNVMGGGGWRGGSAVLENPIGFPALVSRDSQLLCLQLQGS